MKPVSSRNKGTCFKPPVIKIGYLFGPCFLATIFEFRVDVNIQRIKGSCHEKQQNDRDKYPNGGWGK